MKYIKLNSNDPYYNLAVEEYLFRTSNEDIFMLWQNAPTVVIGKNQNAYVEIDLDYARKKNINISRRITGGGAVYHDLGNINYTFIASDNRADVLDYEHFTRPIIDALSFLGLECKLSGRNDLEVDGKKFSGNAQYASNGRILHHGTLLFDTDVNVMSSVLKVDKEKLEYKAVKSHKSRVVNLSLLLSENIGVSDFINSIEKYVLEHMGAGRYDVEINADIEELQKRNSSYEWIYSDKRYLTNYAFTRRKKYPFGIVNVELQISKNIIENIVISGDFFERASVENFEKLLIGKSCDEIMNIDVSNYIDKMTTEEFYALIK